MLVAAEEQAAAKKRRDSDDEGAAEEMLHVEDLFAKGSSKQGASTKRSTDEANVVRNQNEGLQANRGVSVYFQDRGLAVKLEKEQAARAKSQVHE